MCPLLSTLKNWTKSVLGLQDYSVSQYLQLVVKHHMLKQELLQTRADLKDAERYIKTLQRRLNELP
jgi:hypothetical protein